MTYSNPVLLLINEKQQINDSLHVVLTWFSHKHSMEGGPTKATATVTVSDEENTEEILLSVYGKSGDMEIEYDTPVIWKNYKFELIGFNYDRSVEVFISRI